jgi:hypothetical protein
MNRQDIYTLLVPFMIVAGCASEYMPPDRTLTSDVAADASFDTDGTLLATVELGGTLLHFIALEDSSGHFTVGVLESAPAAGHRIDLEPMLADASPREIFHAITRADVDEPALLAELFSEPTLGPRGWHLSAVERGAVSVPKSQICKSTTFRSAFEAWHPYINIKAYDIETSPSSGSSRWSQSDPFAAGGCSYSGYPCMYKWSRTGDYYSANNVDRYKTRVAVCKTQTRTTICHQAQCYSDTGPIITFSYRKGDNTSTGIAFSKDLDSATAEGRYWSWYWNGNSSGGIAANWDWKTGVDWAWTYDRFSIGVAWANEGW